MNSAFSIPKILERHPFYVGKLEPDFRRLETTSSVREFSSFGAALGAFHLELKGTFIPDLEIRDAAWFSRAAPYVLAEVASLADRGEYQISTSETELLEQAGVMIAELSEPLSGLFSSLVHGNCRLENAGFVGSRAAMRNWEGTCLGLPWLDIAVLSMEVETISSEVLVALIGSYAEAADYTVNVVGDLVPFCRALHDVLVLDRWNTELSSGAREAGSLKLESKPLIRRLLELSGA
jgi:hypothetical protein